MVSNVPTSRDILTDSGTMVLGDGWYPLEEFRETKFRWALNDAELFVATVAPNAYVLKVVIEPGPGVGLRPFELEVFASDGTQIAKPLVRGKQEIAIDLPPGLPKVHSLRFHVENGGKPALNDKRILNFRVFDITLEQRPPDIFPAWAKAVEGWYPLENFNGKTFRWVENNAVLEIHPDGGKKLVFDVEPGPGVNSQPFKLMASDGDGKELGTWEVVTRRSVDLELPKKPMRVKFHITGGGKPAPGETRKLNFRIFSRSSA
jgi:hypothetical protein